LSVFFSSYSTCHCSPSFLPFAPVFSSSFPVLFLFRKLFFINPLLLLLFQLFLLPLLLHFLRLLLLFILNLLLLRSSATSVFLWQK
jgi:hypothetical protein